MCGFIESFCRVTKGRDAGSLIQLKPWQRTLLGDLFELKAPGRRRYRQGLIGLPRKNGKSALGSGIGLFGLFDEPGAEVYSCAGDKDQAKIVFAEAKKSVEADPELSDVLKAYKDVIECPSTGGIYRVLSAEAYTKEGLNPSLVIFDEVHVQQNDELWNVMNLGSGTRLNPLVLGITTAGVKYASDGRDSLCFRLWQTGQKVASGELQDNSFFFRWWGAPDGADYRDPAVWRACNPALGDYLFLEDFESVITKIPENEYRTKRLNQWVSAETHWLPHGAWDGCANPDRRIGVDDKVVVGFDGSRNNDNTAVVAWTVSTEPHGEVIACWERPEDAPPGWTVPIIDVEDTIRAVCRRWDVVEVVCDPYGWQRSMLILEEEGLPMVEFPQNPVRMTPATQHFYEAVVNRQLTHSGDARLARHVGNAVLKTDSRGSRIVKESKMSNRKIDLAVASVMAHERAFQLGANPTPVRVPLVAWR